VKEYDRDEGRKRKDLERRGMRRGRDRKDVEGTGMIWWGGSVRRG